MDKIVVKQIGSPIRRHKKQKEHLNSLGLKKIGSIRELQDVPEVRGLISKVHHMIEIINRKDSNYEN